MASAALISHGSSSPRRRSLERMKTRVRWNRHTLALAAIVGGMWYAAEAQSNGAAHLIALLTVTMGALSWLHARANLRGLTLRLAGARPAAQSGSRQIAVELRATGSAAPCGLEVCVLGSDKPVFVERVPTGGVVLVDLPPPAQGSQQALRVLVRSVYPLGLFTAEGQLQTSWIRRVHPKPAGDLPLPAPDPTIHGDAIVVAAGASRSGGGDDFAGLREWRAGDSPRHIDWRAAARGGPLMVKSWSAGVEGAVVLDWEALQLGPDARASQFAAWMELCERDGRPYELRMPDATIRAGLGPVHMRRCLDLLATRMTGGTGSTPSEAMAKASRGRKARTEFREHLPARPLLLLSLALLVAIWPLHGHIATSSIVLCALCLIWRGILRMGVPHVLARIAVIAAGTVAVWTEYSGLEGMEPGIAMLLVLAGAKMLESRSPRDFQIMALIGWFLAFCLLLLDNELSRAVWVVGVFLLIAACMARFRRSRPGMREPTRITAVLFAQAVPLALVLFFVFPRGLLNLGGALGRSRFGETGLDASLNPGRIATLALNSTVAFRARFPDGLPPPNEQRYWRCLTLWECDGLRWRRGARLGQVGVPPRPERGRDVRQIIDLEPHGKQWVPALDRPLRASARGIVLLPDFDESITSPVQVRSAERIEVLSRLELPPLRELPGHHREAALQLPAQIGPELRQLVAGWEAATDNDEQLVQLVLDHIRTQGFSYTLDPGEYGDADGLEEFFLKRRTGFCEHFAASFATLMRMAGVPSRVVVGYLGGEFSDHNGGYLIVKQSDVHAWTEVWLERFGWQRIDPTGALAPDRVNIDLRAWLAGGAEAAERQRRSLWGHTTQHIRLLWDSLSYAWQDEVIDFNLETQRDMLQRLGLMRSRIILLAVSLVAVIVMGLGVGWWLRRPARAADPWLRVWRRVCARLAKTGVTPCRSNEGPLAYADRVVSERPDLSEQVGHFAELYTRGRYGSQAADLRRFRDMLARFKPRRL